MGSSANSLKEVALRAGVSISTVSRVLAGKDYVNERTRRRVLQVAKELNYRPNAMARGLKLGKSNAIAVMIPSIENLIYPPIVRGIEDIARSQGYIVTLCNTDEDIDTEQHYIDKLCNMGVDGIVDATMRKESDHIRSLRAEAFPVVLASRNYGIDVDAVIVDNKGGSHAMTEHLIERGYRHIAFAMGDGNLPLYAERLEGYRTALKENGIQFDPDLVLQEDSGPTDLHPLVQKLMLDHREIDAIFASNDFRAIIIMRALRDMGLHIPEDIAVVGFDDIELGAFIDPPLTTVRQPLYDIGTHAARRLLHQITQKERTGCLDTPTVEVLDTHLVIRNSTK